MSAARPQRYRIHTLAELAAMPPPAFLVDGVIEEDSFVLLYARANHFKSFVTTGLAAAVTSADRWMGRPVANGAVVYVAGEGCRGLAGRAAAWELHHGTVIDRFHVVRQPVPFTDPAAVGDLVASIRAEEVAPVMVIVDTLARCFGNGNENDAQDMNLFVAGVDTVRDAFGCCALVVHHMPYGAEKPRGSSVLEGAVDPMIEGRRDGDVVSLSCTKQKEGEPFDPIRLRAVKVDVGSRTSLVLEPDAGFETEADDSSGSDDGDTDRGESEKEAGKRRLVEALEFLGEMRSSEYFASSAGPDLSESTFHRYVKELVAGGQIEKVRASPTKRS